MSCNTTAQFMDKQIMDLSNSDSDYDFIDFMNRQPEKKHDVVPSYDFMQLRPAVGSSSSPPTAARSLNFDSVFFPLRTWNSVPSRSDAFPFFSHSSFDAEERAKFVFGKSHKPANASLDESLVSEIDKTVKKYANNLMHAINGVSARISQLESRACKLENSMDDLKLSLGNNLGKTEGKIRQLENILREVQTGVQVIRDKQEVVEAELHITNSKLVPKLEQENESQKQPQTDSAQPVASAQPLPSLPPQQSSQPQIQLPNQFPQSQVPSAPQQETYFPLPSQTSVNPSFQYQIPPPLPQQHAPPAPPRHQNETPPQPRYSQPPPPSRPQPGFNLPPPQPHYYQQSPSSQPQPSFPGYNPSSQPPLGHSQEEVPYALSQTYSQAILPPFSGVPPQQFYGPTPNTYEPPSNRPGPGYSGPFGPSSYHEEPYPYSNSPLHYGSSSPVKPQQLTSPMGQNGRSSYANLPTAHILPQALPTASGTGGKSSSGGSGNRVPIDDVINQVTNMGFPRDQVRTTVRTLTENGESVDLNVVLDKLMNDGDSQAPRGWSGQ
ncbi:hypothetical protein CDL12_17294 [Handroanthus impetiginosus]|uniref:UBA domain-containing protein n=1 Tax=Handroanthus impetiginosus TaxID=429701 RepID=A0A2G9GXX4_9LAMI|nr:hypothetical protein CDL12_17294 [Handroanthus impetiginosus]